MAFTIPDLPSFGLTGASAIQQQIWWKAVKDSVEGQVNDILEVQADLQAAIDELLVVNRNSNIATSWCVPANLVTAQDMGSDVKVTIAAHSRVYEDGTTVSVAGHVFNGQAYSTDLGIYYDDPTRADPTPTYHITNNLTRAQNNYAVGRHRVAVLTTPAAGAPDVVVGSTPPGGGKDDIDKYSSL